jgi:ferrous iron transport protein B
LFIKRAGTVILAVSILLWFLASYPKTVNEFGQSQTILAKSYAGQIGMALEPVVRPLGFNWKIGVALIPGFAAREVMIGALATVYSIENQTEEKLKIVLSDKLIQDWSLATALSLIVWYVLACQCLSTLAVTRRETNSWRWPIVMLLYMTTLAYAGSFLTYRITLWLGT